MKKLILPGSLVAAALLINSFTGQLELGSKRELTRVPSSEKTESTEYFISKSRRVKTVTASFYQKLSEDAPHGPFMTVFEGVRGVQVHVQTTNNPDLSCVIVNANPNSKIIETEGQTIYPIMHGEKLNCRVSADSDKQVVADQVFRINQVKDKDIVEMASYRVERKQKILDLADAIEKNEIGQDELAVMNEIEVFKDLEDTVKVLSPASEKRTESIIVSDAEILVVKDIAGEIQLPSNLRNTFKKSISKASANGLKISEVKVSEKKLKTAPFSVYDYNIYSTLCTFGHDAKKVENIVFNGKNDYDPQAGKQKMVPLIVQTNGTLEDNNKKFTCFYNAPTNARYSGELNVVYNKVKKAYIKLKIEEALQEISNKYNERIDDANYPLMIELDEALLAQKPIIEGEMVRAKYQMEGLLAASETLKKLELDKEQAIANEKAEAAKREYEARLLRYLPKKLEVSDSSIAYSYLFQVLPVEFDGKKQTGVKLTNQKEIRAVRVDGKQELKHDIPEIMILGSDSSAVLGTHESSTILLSREWRSWYDTKSAEEAYGDQQITVCRPELTKIQERLEIIKRHPSEKAHNVDTIKGFAVGYSDNARMNKDIAKLGIPKEGGVYPQENPNRDANECVTEETNFSEYKHTNKFQFCYVQADGVLKPSRIKAEYKSERDGSSYIHSVTVDDGNHDFFSTEEIEEQKVEVGAEVCTEAVDNMFATVEQIQERL